MKNLIKFVLASCIVMSSLMTIQAFAAPDLEVNTPAISALKNSMQARHSSLAPHFESGAVGLTGNG